MSMEMSCAKGSFFCRILTICDKTAVVSPKFTFHEPDALVHDQIPAKKTYSPARAARAVGDS